MASLLQGLTKRCVIEDLSVVNDPQSAGFIVHRLMTAGEVDDAEAAVSQCGLLVEEKTGVIRTAVGDGIRHASKNRCASMHRLQRDKAGDPTHFESSLPTLPIRALCYE